MSDLFESVTGVRAALSDVSARGKLRMSGSDHVRFLNGMISNDVENLATGSSCYAALLDRKGHVLSDLRALAMEEAFLLDTAPECGNTVAEILEKHVIADDVSIENLGSSWGHVAIEGPGAADVLSVPESDHFEPLEHQGDRIWCLGGGLVSPAGAQLMGPGEAVTSFVRTLRLPTLGDEQAEILRIEAFRPRFGVDFGERHFPNEARIDDRAVSYSKGCYIGQEIIARIHSRGAVNRLLCLLHTEARVKPADPILSGSTRVGEITSSAVSPVSGPVALGYVKRAASEPGTRLEVAGTAAEVAR